MPESSFLAFSLNSCGFLFNLFQTNQIFHKATYNKGWSKRYIEGSQAIISRNMVYFFSLKIDFALADNPDEMSHYAAFHLDLHRLPK